VIGSLPFTPAPLGRIAIMTIIYLRRPGARELAFDAQIAQLHQQRQEHSGVFGFPDFKGPAVGPSGVFRA
jgi:hypothetical protein